MERYEYQPLTDALTQIRLLQIHPGENSDPVSISIRSYERGQAPRFAALSYTWGSPDLAKGIKADGRLLQVTESCWYALGQFRLSQLHRYLWIDAICIDQPNLEEKGMQVNFMGETYRQAEHCIVSLGRHTRSSALLYKALLRANLAIDSDSPDPLELQLRFWLSNLAPDEVHDLMKALLDFGNHAYWNRVWIVQEFCLPRKVSLLCGSQCLPLHILEALFQAYNPLDTPDPSSTPGMKKILALRTTVQKSDGGVATLPQLLVDLGYRECSDPRDRVYGLLSLVDWDTSPSGGSLEADYSLSTRDLAAQVLTYCFAGNPIGRLDTVIARRLLGILCIDANDSYMLAAAGLRTMTEQRNHSTGNRTKTVTAIHSGWYQYRVPANEGSSQSLKNQVSRGELPSTGTKLPAARRSSTKETPSTSVMGSHRSVLEASRTNLTVSSLVQLDASMIAVEISHLLWDTSQEAEGLLTLSSCRPVIVIKPLEGHRCKLVCHGFINPTANAHTEDSVLNNEVWIDAGEFLFWIWKLHHTPEEQRVSAMLDFRIGTDNSTSHAMTKRW